ncbi:MAG: DUF6261 family protein [Mangrovibacterium sp.]
MAANLALTNAIEQNKALSDLEEFDEKRDEAFKKAYNLLKGMAALEGIPVEESVSIIFSIFKEYGLKSTGLSYNEQTGAMNSIIEGLESTENKAHIANITYLEPLVEELKTAQLNFIKVYSDYVSRVREDKETPSATALKPQVIECLNNKLIPYLNIQILFQPELEPFAAEVAIVIEKANNTVKERRKK